MQKDRFAAESLHAAFKYNITRAKRYRLLHNGNENNDHIPTVQELTILKDKMYQASANFKEVIQNEKADRDQVRRDTETDLLKKQVEDLNEKFNYFVTMMAKAKKIEN